VRVSREQHTSKTHSTLCSQNVQQSTAVFEVLLVVDVDTTQQQISAFEAAIAAHIKTLPDEWRPDCAAYGEIRLRVLKGRSSLPIIVPKAATD
jgi:hypothetical protein